MEAPHSSIKLVVYLYELPKFLTPQFNSLLSGIGCSFAEMSAQQATLKKLEAEIERLTSELSVVEAASPSNVASNQ